MIRFNYRDRQNVPQHPEPLLLDGVTLPKDIQRILIVDDVSVSGKTLLAAKDLFKQYQVTTLVFRGQADYVLLPQLKDCVKWPWKI